MTFTKACSDTSSLCQPATNPKKEKPRSQREPLAKRQPEYQPNIRNLTALALLSNRHGQDAQALRLAYGHGCAVLERGAVRLRMLSTLQVITFIGVYTATKSLVAAALNLTSFNQEADWPTTSSSCAYSDRKSDNSVAAGGGLGRNDTTLVYDLSFFSFAGCRCISGYDNVYTFDASGTATHLLLQPWSQSLLTYNTSACLEEA